MLRFSVLNSDIFRTILPPLLQKTAWEGDKLYPWFELRWGITACVVLAVGLITTVFYNHPSTTNVTLFFRTIPIISETTGRVAEVYVGFTGKVEKGAPIFRLDSSAQEASVETARRRIAEVEADLVVAGADLLKAEGQIQEAKSAHQQAVDELSTKQELQRRNPGIVAQRDIEKLQVTVDGRLGGIAAATAAKQAIEARMSSLLRPRRPALKPRWPSQVELNKTVIRAGVPAASSSLHSGWAILSLRSCAQPESSSPTVPADKLCRPASGRSKHRS